MGQREPNLCRPRSPPEMDGEVAVSLSVVGISDHQHPPLIINGMRHTRELGNHRCSAFEWIRRCPTLESGHLRMAASRRERHLVARPRRSQEKPLAADRHLQRGSGHIAARAACAAITFVAARVSFSPPILFIV